MPKKKSGDEDLEDNEEGVEDSESTDPSYSASADRTSVTQIDELVEEEVEEEDDAPQSMLDKIKAKLVPAKKKSDDEDDDEEESKGKGDKKRNPLILVIAAVGLIFFLFADELFPPEPEAPPASPVVPAYKKKLKEPPQDTAKTETPAATPPVEGEPKAEDNGEVVAKPTTEDQPTDTVDVAPTTDTAVAEPTTEEPVVAEPVVEPTTEEPATSEPSLSMDEPMDTSPVTETDVTEEPTQTPIAEPPAPENPVAIEDEPEGPSTDLLSPPTTTDTVDEGIPVSGEDENLTDKILEDLEKQAKSAQPKVEKKEYVAPPDYEYKGRGLVYNCAGKHWACVDGASYKSCEDNFSSVNYLKKPIECFPFNVYQSGKGCELMQNRVVSSNAKTDFCKGN